MGILIENSRTSTRGIIACFQHHIRHSISMAAELEKDCRTSGSKKLAQRNSNLNKTDCEFTASQANESKNSGSNTLEKEINGPSGLEPTRYGDWEAKGRCYDF